MSLDFYGNLPDGFLIMLTIGSLCVFCGSRQGQSPAFAETAMHTGRVLAEREITLVYGGGSVGLMGILANACLEAGGQVTGVITRKLMDREVGHRGLSDAFIALPGGIGTLDELFEMLTWTQLQIHDKPSGLLNIEGYYDSLIRFLNDSVCARGFATAPEIENLKVAGTLERLLDVLAGKK